MSTPVVVPRTRWLHSGGALQAAPLLHLLGATKPEFIDSTLVAVFRGRHEGVTQERRKRIAEDCGGLSSKDTDDLVASLSQLIHNFLFLGVDTKEGVFGLFPADFHPSLRALLSKLLMGRLAEWKEVLLSSSVGPAKLVDFDWRVDVKSSSNHISHMAVPTVLVDMKLQPQPTSTQLISPLESVNFELTPAALTTLLNGLEKIQSQLSATLTQ
jgi:hypothetical protein